MQNIDGYLQQLINGLVTGSIYAMVALGYTMVYGILGIINFAHGEVMMIGAMVAMTVSTLLISMGLPIMLVLLISALLAMIACMMLSFLIERVAYRPLRNAPKLAPLITAIGVSFLLQAAAQVVWGKSPRLFPEMLPSTRVILFHDVGITVREIVIVVLSMVMMVGLVTLVLQSQS